MLIASEVHTIVDVYVFGGVLKEATNLFAPLTLGAGRERIFVECTRAIFVIDAV